MDRWTPNFKLKHTVLEVIPPLFSTQNGLKATKSGTRFQWCQGMSLGILKRFREKNAQFFFRDFNFGWKIQRLLLGHLELLQPPQLDQVGEAARGELGAA